MGSTIGNSLTKITDYKKVLEEKTLEQYKGKTNFTKLFEVFSVEFQNIENMFWDLYEKRWITSSEGQQLDNLGYNLDIERQGLSDTDYRQIIYAKIGQYNSNGTIDEISSLVKLMTNADKIIINELYPAKIEITIIGDNLNLNKDFLKASIQKSIAGGVGLELIIAGHFPVFCYAKESGDPLPSNFSGYPAEDGTTKSYYMESV